MSERYYVVPKVGSALATHTVRDGRTGDIIREFRGGYTARYVADLLAQERNRDPSDGGHHFRMGGV